MLLLSKTYNEQASLAAYCRTGDIALTGKVDKERVIHYRRLVFNVVKDSLSAAYPLTRNLIEAEEWELLMNEFFANHNCQATQIWKMPEELITYTEAKEHQLYKKYYVLQNLLRFEWLEIELYMQEDIEVEFSEDGNLHLDRLVLNPECKLEGFSYPVHLKNAGHIDENEKGQYFLSLHRHPVSGKVLFTDLSPAFVRIIELLSERPLNVDELSGQIVKEFKIKNIESIKELIYRFLESAIKNKLLLGYES